ncbi:MAG TPA: TetR/AcrR family transcriptional regulator [Aliidongia sp.]|uniref:TetR/AcrR family transcriptional regulator n=1 Tax=Aliidongia sp. TaxID=1914230 RepID=UPI002DDD8AF5|nr:TetR/AcrR family transcriptional regulator [Aliidongia sp.]HEV2676982.1 TetR/AcrR family transcriptional regulator [Aliidongia sp.]
MSKPAPPPPDPQIADGPAGKVGLILSAARHLFLEQGYGNTSMDGVAKRAGVSKATLYVHFESKERLFAEVIDGARSRLREALVTITGNEQIDPAETLRLIGQQFLRFVTTQEVLTLFRAVIGETQRFPELGQTIFQAGSSDMLTLITDSIAQASARGTLRVENPKQAAAQFIALTKSDLHLRCLLEPSFQANEADIQRNVDAAVAVFMSHYGPRPR